MKLFCINRKKLHLGVKEADIVSIENGSVTCKAGSKKMKRRTDDLDVYFFETYEEAVQALLNLAASRMKMAEIAYKKTMYTMKVVEAMAELKRTSA